MPEHNLEHRKLAAIMFTDMVGYPETSGAQRNKALALSSVPEGQSKIAQRFIAGMATPEAGKPRRGDRTSTGFWRGPCLSPRRGLGALRALPSVETLGYCLSSSGLEP
ncbi:MAG: hypothetical protein DME26_02315 [Verrucomicrobia bacterium]|nr:MAG: hypothetical protein DME26_02315 [Verrucomicrobiota bacterium]